MPNRGQPSSQVYHVRNTHAILYGVSILLFALAALLLPLWRCKSTVRIHYGIQIVATMTMFGGFACGVWLTQNGDGVTSKYVLCGFPIAHSLEHTSGVGELN